MTGKTLVLGLVLLILGLTAAAGARGISPALATEDPPPSWRSPCPAPWMTVECRKPVARSCRWKVWAMSLLGEPLTSASAEAGILTEAEGFVELEGTNSAEARLIAGGGDAAVAAPDFETGGGFLVAESDARAESTSSLEEGAGIGAVEAARALRHEPPGRDRHEEDGDHDGSPLQEGVGDGVDHFLPFAFAGQSAFSTVSAASTIGSTRLRTPSTDCIRNFPP